MARKMSKRTVALMESTHGRYVADGPVTGYVWTTDGCLEVDVTGRTVRPSTGRARERKAVLALHRARELEKVMAGPYVVLYLHGRWAYSLASVNPLAIDKQTVVEVPFDWTEDIEPIVLEKIDGRWTTPARNVAWWNSPGRVVVEYPRG